MKLTKTYLFVLSVLFIPLTTQAIVIFGVGPKAGYYKTEETEDGKIMVGAAARLKLGPSLGFEGAIDYKSEKYMNDALTVKSWPVTASVLLYPLPIIKVYGLAGVGWYNTTYEYDPQKVNMNLTGGEQKVSEQEMGYHIGAGLELPLGGPTLAADIRYVKLNYDLSELNVNNEIDSDFYSINISLLFGI
jgi:opacity protein-like surface antigen